MDNTNGNLADAYTGTTTPTNTQASRLNASSTTVPSGAAVSEEFTGAASTSFQRNQTDTQKVIDDYNKKIAVIDAKISALTAEKAKIEANLNNKDFSDEERRMIESYTTLGDLDAGVKQIMSNRQFKSALDQTQANEDKYNQEAKDAKTLAYKNAVNDAASFYYTSADSSGNMSVEDTKKYGVLKATLKEAALAARVGNDDADKALGAKVKQMQEEANDEFLNNKRKKAETNAATGLDEFLNNNYETLRKNAETANKNNTFGLGNETVTVAIAGLAAKRKAITEDNSINEDDKKTYQGKIDAVLKDLEAYKKRSDDKRRTGSNASTRKGDIATAKAKAKEGYGPLRDYLLSGSLSANNVLNYLGIQPETVRAFKSQEEMVSLSEKINALK